MKLGKIIDVLDLYAPSALAADWDSSGLQIGSREDNIERAVVCLDVTPDVLEDAVEYGAQLIVSHHPLLFDPVKSIGDDPYSLLLRSIVRQGIDIFSCHTPFDASRFGINAYSAFRLGIKTDAFLENSAVEGCGFGVCGELSSAMSFKELTEKVKTVFSTSMLKVSSYYSDEPIQRVAFMGGSGSDYLEKACELGAQVYITSDIKNSGFIKAWQVGLPLIVMTHFDSEKCFIKIMKDLLTKECPTLTVMESSQGDLERFI